MASLENAPGGPSASRAAPLWRSAWPTVLIFAAFGPLLVLHARLIWSRPHYQFFPLVIPGALALAYRYGRGLGRLEPGPRGLAGGLAALGWLLLAAGSLLVWPVGATVGALVTLFAAFLALGGWPLVRAMLPAWAFLWLAVPLPYSLDVKLVTGLQSLVSRWSSAFLDALGIFHVMEGNVVELPGRRLLVDQACSGIYSLLTLMLGTVFYAFWNRIPVVRGLVLLVAAVFWVVFGNITRIVSIVVLFNRYGIDASVGKKHEALGLTVFVGMLFMVWSTDRFFSFLGSCVKAVWHMATASRQPNSVRPAVETSGVEGAKTVLPSPGRTWLGSGLVGGAFGVLLFPQLLMPGVNWKEVLTTYDIYGKKFEVLTEDALPKRWQSFERVGFRTEHRTMEDSWGENSKFWFYRRGDRGVVVSVDYQFVDWHDLVICYTSQGWQITGRRVLAPDENGPKSMVILDMVNPQGWYGYVIYSLYRSDGRPVVVPESVGFLQNLAGRALGWFRPKARGDLAVATLSYQMQVFVESEVPLDQNERDLTAAFYDHLRGVVQKTGLGVEVGGAEQ